MRGGAIAAEWVHVAEPLPSDSAIADPPAAIPHATPATSATPASAPAASARSPDDGLGKFSRARRREYHARATHWRAIVLHPQRIYRAMRELSRREGGEEAIGRFQHLLSIKGWHPTDLCALRRFVAFGCGRDVAKPYNWAPRGARRRRGLARLGDAFGAGKFAWSVRGVGQIFWSQLMAAGDGVPVDRCTVREVFADLEAVGLCSVHQPPEGAKLAPFERSGKYAFNQYWFAMVGQLRKPNMRGFLDTITDWAALSVLWWAQLQGSPPS